MQNKLDPQVALDPRITEAMVKLTLELNEKGFTSREIGKRVGKSHDWVAKVIRKNSGRAIETKSL